MSLGGPAQRHSDIPVGLVPTGMSEALQQADVVYVTRGLDIVWVSPSVTEYLGWAVDDLLGQPAIILLSPDQDQAWVDANRHRLLAGRDVVQKVLLRRRDGAERWFSGVARAIPESDAGVAGFLVTLQDIHATARARRSEPLDGVTGLLSRRVLFDVVDEAVQQLAGPGGFGFILIEFDNLRAVNESAGLATGDAALSEFANRILNRLLPGEEAGRVSGKGFGIACPSVVSADALRSRAESIVAGISSEIRVTGRRVEPIVLASAVLAEPGTTCMTLIREADIAIGTAREVGSPSVTVFTADLADRAVRRSALEEELRFALEAEEFGLVYQPIVSLADRSPVAVEALLRWRHPREGLIAPDDFLLVAEQSQLVRPLGRTVLSMVCAALAALPAHTLQIGVNVSPVELSDEGWVDGVLGIVDQWGVDPCCLVFELTESAVQSSRRPIQADLMRLRKRGVGIFLSNFGTGSSSRAMLRDLPVTGLKLDASLVATVDRPGSFGAALAKGIIEVVRPLGLAGVAEGVETEEQAASLAEIGWDFGQGYLFARPGSLNSVSPVPARLLGALPN